MNYRQRNKKNKYFKIAIVGVAFVILFFGGFLFRNFFQGLASPIINSYSNISNGANNFLTYFKTKNGLQKLNEQLKAENQDLNIEMLTLESFKKENKELREILNFSNPSKNFVNTKILTKPPFSPFDTFIIESDDRIAVDQKVFYKNVLLGKVIETYNTTAIIKLFSSPDEKISVKISDNEFEAIGQGGLSFKVKLPKSLNVEIGDPIHALETGNVVGVVEVIKIDEAGAFQDIYFKYPINISELNYVQISI